MSRRSPAPSEVVAEFLRHPCAFCKRPLDDEWTITQAQNQARRRKLPAPRPGDVCCLRKDCIKARKRRLREGATASGLVDVGELLAEHDNPQDSHREKELFYGTQTRRDEDGQARKEAPRTDCEFFTSTEIADLGIDKEARTDLQIFQDTFDSAVLGERCKLHGTPDCGACRMLDQSYKRVGAGIVKIPLQAVENIPSPNPSLLSLPLAQEVLKIIKNRDPKTQKETDREKHGRRKGSFKYSRREDQRAERKRPQSTPEKQTAKLRREHGYDVRELSALLDDPRINASILKTDDSWLWTDSLFKKWREQISRGERTNPSVKRPDIKLSPQKFVDLWNLLPQKWVPIFTSDEIKLYKDYAAGNYPIDFLRKRIQAGYYGSTDLMKSSDDVLLDIENRIIVQAWATKLLVPAKPGLRPNDKERDIEEGHNLEVNGIKTGAAEGGSIIGRGQSRRTGRTLALDSFERGGVITRRGSDDNDFSDSQSTVEDGYGEEDAA